MGERRFKIERVQGAPVSDAELLDDLKKIAASLRQSTVSQPKYDEVGTYARSTVSRRFGSWNNALLAAGLTTSIASNETICDDRLFENILSLWQRFGRQPRLSETYSEFSSASGGAYKRRFKSWGAALAAFVDYANGDDTEECQVQDGPDVIRRKQSPRAPSLRLRYKVLVRDGFKCCLCGASPATTVGVTLHIDHIRPWSKSGETTLENLRTTCEPCSLGKGDLAEKPVR